MTPRVRRPVRGTVAAAHGVTAAAAARVGAAAARSMTATARVRVVRELTDEAATLIRNLRRHFEREMAETRRILLKKPAERTAVATSVSRRTVFSRECVWCRRAHVPRRDSRVPSSWRRIPPEEYAHVPAAIYQQYRDKILPTIDSNLHLLITCQEGVVGSGAGGCEQSEENFSIESVGTHAGARVENGAGPKTGLRASPVASAGVGIAEAGGVGRKARGGGQGAYLWSRSTLFRALQDIGFTFSKRPTHYDVAREKPSVIHQGEDIIDTLRL